MGSVSSPVDSGRKRADALLATMAGGTYVLILLGIYTAAIGAGLTCDGRWPLCDGAVFGLFPANWPSFVEWFHRLVAMITGFLILGGWIVVWRSGRSRRAFLAMTTAVGLLPVQIWLGAETVLRYEIVTLIAHFLTALVIFSGVILGVVWHWGLHRFVPSYSRAMLSGTLVLLAPFLVLKPQFLFIHTGAVQMLYYGIGLGMFVAFMLVAVAGRSHVMRELSAFGVGLMTLQLVVGRLVRSPIIETVDWVGAGATVLIVLVALWVVTNIASDRSS